MKPNSENKKQNIMQSNDGFTMIELIIVIAIIVVLAGIAIPTFSGMVETAQEAACISERTNLVRIWAAEEILDETYTFETCLAENDTLTCPCDGIYTLAIPEEEITIKSYSIIACSVHGGDGSTSGGNSESSGSDTETNQTLNPTYEDEDVTEYDPWESVDVGEYVVSNGLIYECINLDYGYADPSIHGLYNTWRVVGTVDGNAVQLDYTNWNFYSYADGIVVEYTGYADAYSGTYVCNISGDAESVVFSYSDTENWTKIE